MNHDGTAGTTTNDTVEPLRCGVPGSGAARLSPGISPHVKEQNETQHHQQSTTSLAEGSAKEHSKRQQPEAPPPPTAAAAEGGPLPRGFAPGPHDVLCGRGRECKTASGNRAYREAILLRLPAYSAASTKIERSAIITEVVDDVRRKCREYHAGRGFGACGGFVRRHEAASAGSGAWEDVGDLRAGRGLAACGGFVRRFTAETATGGGAWEEVGELHAREKTSQCFRDALADRYSSSARSKYRRRRGAQQLRRERLPSQLPSPQHHHQCGEVGQRGDAGPSSAAFSCIEKRVIDGVGGSVQRVQCIASWRGFIFQ